MQHKRETAPLSTILGAAFVAATLLFGLLNLIFGSHDLNDGGAFLCHVSGDLDACDRIGFMNEARRGFSP